MPVESAELHLDDDVLGDAVYDALRCGPDDGEPVLLLHGWPQTSLEWSRVLPPLASSGCTAVAVDQRGYSPGARPTGTSAYALMRLVDDAASMIGALGWESAHVVGHDWGAAVAWALAATRPGLVRSLVAVSTPHPRALSAAIRDDADQQARTAYMQFFRTEPEKAAHVLMRDDAKALRAVYGDAVHGTDVERYVEHFAQDGAMLASLQWYAAIGHGDLAQVGTVAVPTTFLWGSDDVAIGAAAAHGSGEWCTGAYEMRTLQGCGHWIPDVDPNAVVDAVLARIG